MQTPNPYAAPGEIVPLQTPSTGSAMAVFIGASIGAGTNYFVAVLFGWVGMWVMTFDGIPVAKLYVTMGQSATYLMVAHVTSTVCALAGGYWSAHLSREKHLTHAFLASLIIIVCVLLQLTYPYDLPIPDWSKAMSLITPIPCYLLGAWWERRGNA